ncbi:hypothetical protein HDU67_009652 [Dinochytrium kinnereticum]|nr:hypothetical protein HDU67_009652 [Dinochytrium kinnereticum]
MRLEYVEQEEDWERHDAISSWYCEVRFAGCEMDDARDARRLIPDDQAYTNLRTLERQLPSDQFELLKERVMKPYRARNFAIGLTLVGFCGAMFAYSMYKTKIEDFESVVNKPKKDS